MLPNFRQPHLHLLTAILTSASSNVGHGCIHTSGSLYAGANVGDNVAIFEQGARHVGKDIAGKGIANPLATLLSTSMMFRHLNLPDFSDR